MYTHRSGLVSKQLFFRDTHTQYIQSNQMFFYEDRCVCKMEWTKYIYNILCIYYTNIHAKFVFVSFPNRKKKCDFTFFRSAMGCVSARDIVYTCFLRIFYFMQIPSISTFDNQFLVMRMEKNWMVFYPILAVMEDMRLNCIPIGIDVFIDSVVLHGTWKLSITLLKVTNRIARLGALQKNGIHLITLQIRNNRGCWAIESNLNHNILTQFICHVQQENAYIVFAFIFISWTNQSAINIQFCCFIFKLSSYRTISQHKCKCKFKFIIIALTIFSVFSYFIQLMCDSCRRRRYLLHVPFHVILAVNYNLSIQMSCKSLYLFLIAK